MSTGSILYLSSFTNPKSESPASDEVGYGITASNAIKDQLETFGYELHELPSGENDRASSQAERGRRKLRWIHKCYEQLLSVDLQNYDAVFVFHTFHQFPCELRRILLDLGYPDLRLVGYSLGSHWDPTDAYR